jgi:phosphatidate cytidylyltransferase
MALNKQTFITRTLTAIVFAAIMLLGLLWNHWSFFILFSVIHFGCWWEYLKLTERIHKTTLHIYTRLGFMLMGYGIMLLFCGEVYQLYGYSIKNNLSLPISVAGFALLLMGIFQANIIRTKAIVMAGVGVSYISLCWGLMLDLTSVDSIIMNNSIIKPVKGTSFYLSDIVIYGSETVLFVIAFPLLTILSIWINDTMAYIVGSLMGRTPLSKISPKKTWEGTIGGIILSSFSVALIGKYLLDFSFIHSLFIAFTAAITGTFGDLLESKLKRMANVKDSGSIMPGHGGFLDRFDSLLLATPFVWLYVIFFL